jgi:hypothetical protein
LNQISELFDRDKSVISKNLKNIFDEGELVRDSVVAQYASTAADGKSYKVDYYRLEMCRLFSKPTRQLVKRWLTNCASPLLGCSVI